MKQDAAIGDYGAGPAGDIAYACSSLAFHCDAWLTA